MYKKTSTGERWFVYDEAGRLLGEYTTTSAREYLWMDDGTLIGIVDTTPPGITPSEAVTRSLPAANMLGTRAAGQVTLAQREADPPWQIDPLFAPLRPASGLIFGTSQVATLYYVQADQLGTPRVAVQPGATSADDTIVWTWDYYGETFGADAPTTDTIGLNLRFPGQYNDTETGLNYNYYRDYEPATGRYIQSDPIGLQNEASASSYGYTLNNPLRYYDTKGQNTLGVVAGVVVVGGACFIIHCEFKARDICSKQYPNWQNDISQANARLGCIAKILKACLSLGSVAVDPIKESVTIPMEPHESESQCKECPE